MKYIGDIKMNQIRCPKFMCTSVSVVDERTHYFKSWEKKDGELGLYDVIERSFAAPLYFGAVVDEKDQQVWLDGGTGLDNCPVMNAYAEAIRQKWDEFHILSIGTGDVSNKVSYKEAKKMNWDITGETRQLLYYLSLPSGGLGRKQSTASKIDTLGIIASASDKFSMQRLDTCLTSKLDKMDNIKAVDEYIRIADKLAEKIDYSKL
jgi:hypothetical protein